MTKPWEETIGEPDKWQKKLEIKQGHRNIEYLQDNKWVPWYSKIHNFSGFSNKELILINLSYCSLLGTLLSKFPRNESNNQRYPIQFFEMYKSYLYSTHISMFSPGNSWALTSKKALKIMKTISIFSTNERIPRKKKKNHKSLSFCITSPFLRYTQGPYHSTKWMVIEKPSSSEDPKRKQSNGIFWVFSKI